MANNVSGFAYDDKVERYEKWFADNEFLLNAEVEAVEQLLPTGGDGVEIGVGTGIFAQRLGIRHGVEPSAAMRLRALDRGIDVINASAEELPFDDSSFDYAIMVTVDCFLQDIIKAFREIKRILKPEGCFIIAFIDRDTSLGQLYNKHKNGDEFYKDATFHSAAEIAGLLRDVGLVPDGFRQTVFTLENTPQSVEEGTGEGVFAVIRAKKL